MRNQENFRYHQGNRSMLSARPGRDTKRGHPTCGRQYGRCQSCCFFKTARGFKRRNKLCLMFLARKTAAKGAISPDGDRDQGSRPARIKQQSLEGQQRAFLLSNTFERKSAVVCAVLHHQMLRQPSHYYTPSAARIRACDSNRGTTGQVTKAARHQDIVLTQQTLLLFHPRCECCFKIADGTPPAAALLTLSACQKRVPYNLSQASS